MLDTSNLSEFLKGITDALRTKKGTTDVIEHKLIDEEIENIPDYEDYYGLVEALLNKSEHAGFFEGSYITDKQLARFSKDFPNKLGSQGSWLRSIDRLFAGCNNLTVVPEGAFYIDERGINGKDLFIRTSEIVAIWVPLRFYCEDSGHNTYYQDATDILPTYSMSNSTLKEIRVAENGIKQSIDFSYYYGFSKESYMSIADGLIDLTGTGNTYKLTINRSYRAMGNDDYDKFILKIHNKGWTIVEK